MDQTLDELLPKIGGFGLYQIYIITILGLSTIINPIVYMSFIFTSMVVNHRCKIPECESNPPTYLENWVRYAVPNDENGAPKKCERYKFIEGKSCNESNFNKKETQKCNEFVYGGDEYTLMQEFDLHCESGVHLLSLVGMMVVLGQIPGIVIGGLVSDKFGRRTCLVAASILSGCTGIVKIFLPNYIAFLVVQFLDSLFGSGSFICVFVLSSEFVAPNWRSFVGNLMSAIFSIGGIYLCVIWIFILHWKYLLIAIHGPQFLHILLLWIIPESARWNLINGRVEKAKKTLRKLAKINRKELTEEQLESLEGNKETTEETGDWKMHLKLAMKSKTLWIRIIICTFCFITCTFVYYGLTIGSVALSGRYYLDFCLTIIVEIPAFFLCELFIQLFGRKKVFSLNFIITAIACLVFIFIPKNRYAQLSCWLLGKFAITFSFSLIYVYISELFPTPLRSTYLGASATISRFGLVSAILVPSMRQVWENLPLILFAAFTGVSGIISFLFLPETKGKKLADTIEEAENLKYAPLV